MTNDSKRESAAIARQKIARFKEKGCGKRNKGKL